MVDGMNGEESSFDTQAMRGNSHVTLFGSPYRAKIALGIIVINESCSKLLSPIYIDSLASATTLSPFPNNHDKHVNQYRTAHESLYSPAPTT